MLHFLNSSKYPGCVPKLTFHLKESSELHFQVAFFSLLLVLSCSELVAWYDHYFFRFLGYYQEMFFKVTVSVKNEAKILHIVGEVYRSPSQYDLYFSILYFDVNLIAPDFFTTRSGPATWNQSATVLSAQLIHYLRYMNEAAPTRTRVLTA